MREKQHYSIDHLVDRINSSFLLNSSILEFLSLNRDLVLTKKRLMFNDVSIKRLKRKIADIDNDYFIFSSNLKKFLKIER